MNGYRKIKDTIVYDFQGILWSAQGENLFVKVGIAFTVLIGWTIIIFNMPTVTAMFWWKFKTTAHNGGRLTAQH